jgi:SAM-dependent methyltransferase
VPEHQVLVNEHFETRAAYWKSVYDGDDLTRNIIRERSERCLQWIRELRLPINTEILDVGCGAGFIAVNLARSGYRVHAVDAVQTMVDLTGQSAEDAGVKSLVLASRGDACSLDRYPDEKFGLVVSLGVFGWLESPEIALREIYRVLRPNGYFIFSIGNRWCLQDALNPLYNPLLAPLWRKPLSWLRSNGWLRRPSGSNHNGELPTLRHLTGSEADRMLLTAGFRKLRSASIGFGPFGVYKVHLLKDSNAKKLHRALQSLADRDFPLLRSSGAIYVALLLKPSN